MITLNRIIKNIFKFILEYKFTILFILYLYIVNHLLIESFNILRLLCVISFFFIVHLLSKTKYSIPLSIILAFLLSVDAYFAFIYRERMTLSILSAILETNPSEVRSVITPILIYGSIILAITTALILLSQKELKNIRLPRKVSLIIIILFWLYIPIYTYHRILSRDDYKGEFDNSPYTSFYRHMNFKFPLVYGDIMAYITYKEEMSKINKYKNTERLSPPDIKLTNASPSPQKIYIVIGESSAKDHYSLYGYPVKTTPFLDSLSTTDIDIKHYDGISAAPSTRDAMRLAISHAGPFTPDDFYTYKNIVELGNDARYETIWISNQDKLGVYDTYIGIMSSTADKSYYGSTFPRYDIDLIPEIRKMHDENKKQAFFIHLYGSHLSYDHRITDEDRKALPGENNAVNDYDRSIYHTDRTLREIYKIMEEDSSSVLYYFPDHGEIIGKGHGFMEGGARQFEIPIITINRSQIPLDSILIRYIDDQSKLVNNSNSFHIISEIMGYKVTDSSAKEAAEYGKYVYHADGKIYLFKDVQKSTVNN